MIAGVGADKLRHLGEGDTACAEHHIQLIERGEATIGQGFIGERPEPFRRLEFGGMGGERNQFNAGRDLDLATHMPARLIEDQEDVGVLPGSHLPGEVGQRGIEGSDIHPWQEQPVGPPGGGMEKGIDIEPLVAVPDDGQGATAFAGPDLAQDGFEAHPMFIGGPDLYPFSCGSSLLDALGKALRKAACAAGSACSCRGRGT